jgi:hypothetical protein
MSDKNPEYFQLVTNDKCVYMQVALVCAGLK